MEFEAYLTGLDESALTALLDARPDVLVEPVPRGFAQLAQRLCSASSLVSVLQTLNRDQLVAGEAITAGTQDRLDRRLFAQVLAQLRALGLVWGTDLRLPPLLAQHWSFDSGHHLDLSGPPKLPPAGTDPVAARPAAQAAVATLLDGVAGLLDGATERPIAALKKGGIGSREVSRLARELSAQPGSVALWLDLAGLSGLLGPVEAGFAPTADYPRWRADSPARRWAKLAVAWHSWSESGPVPRALLTACAGGVSVRAAADELDWFCPVLEEQDDLDELLQDAEALGLVAHDVLTELGEFLAGRRADVDDLLPEQASGVILQSDLTAIVSGVPPRVVSAAAVREAGAVWRFSATSIRSALDAGWSAEDLARALADLSPVPQPLSYLVNDVARRHGHIRVRAVRCCVLADEATAAEISHRLPGFTALAPTVLSSSDSPEKVLAVLRKAGYAPTREDQAGTVMVERPKTHLAEADAIDREADVVIGYRDRAGNRTIRRIRPEQLLGECLDSWCHLREDERSFAVANIESVEAAR